jgi:hypothetical protein
VKTSGETLTSSTDARLTPSISPGLGELGATTNKPDRHALRVLVWAARTGGWILIAMALLNALPIAAIPRLAGSVKLLSSVALGLVGLAWVAAVELFLTFFNRYLSGN